MTNKPTEQETLDALIRYTGEQALDTMNKVLRQKNAKEFIKTLGKDFNEVQTNQLIDMLCNYEQFLNEKS
jgi:hypothetical protein